MEAESGIDVGLSAFAVLSDGSKIDSPRFLRRAEKKLTRLQRDLSRKAKGSKNGAKAHIKVVRQHRQGGGRAPGLAPQGFHIDHSRQLSGVRGRPCGVRPRGRTRLSGPCTTRDGPRSSAC
ncbi:transposase [Streptomyces massasporeus]|uniref:transposase n=1 Tax=Streptomyces massasporeus TaxID=67324 RepID=UPI0036947F8D